MDLHVTLNANAVESNESNSECGKISLRKVFRAKLAEFVQSHPQGDDVPQEPLPELFNRGKLNENSNVEVKRLSSAMEEMASIPVAKLISSPIKVTSTPVKPASSPPEPTLATPLKPVTTLANVPSTPAKNESPPAIVALSTPESVPTPARLYSTSLAARLQKGSSGCSDSVDGSTNPPLKEQEKKAMEDQNPAISLAERRRKMITCLPKLFNVIHYLIQSIRRWVITREELVHKIIAGHSVIADRKEVEELLMLMQEFVSEWMSEKISSSGDKLICINKLASPETIRLRLEEENKLEMAPLLS